MTRGSRKRQNKHHRPSLLEDLKPSPQTPPPLLLHNFWKLKNNDPPKSPPPREDPTGEKTPANQSSASYQQKATDVGLLLTEKPSSLQFWNPLTRLDSVTIVFTFIDRSPYVISKNKEIMTTNQTEVENDETVNTKKRAKTLMVFTL